jgi:cytochrome b
MLDMTKVETGKGIPVWDLPTRLFHWLLFPVLVGSWVTHELGLEWTGVHMWFGYTALTMVLFRIIWGFVGPAHARFSSFLAGPTRTRAYARAWRQGPPPKYSGHNPLGGWAIVAMLACIVVQAVTGMFNGDEIMYSGPWHWTVSEDVAGAIEEIHEINFSILLGLIALHVAAIVSYWLRWRTNLVTPMLTGRKPVGDADPAAAISGNRLRLAIVALGLAAAAVWLFVFMAPTTGGELIY